MELKPGTRLESATSDAQVVVVRAPTDGSSVDLRCGGMPMREAGSGEDRADATVDGDDLLMGKRYADDEVGIELLCTAPGAGPLTIGDQPLLIKGAKPLPSSD